MPGRRKLIVVSNRGPVTYGRDNDGERVARRGGGGLVTALRSLVSHHDVTWIASAMSDEDRAVAVESGGAAIDERARDGSPFRLRLVAHDETAYDWFYNVVSNPMLWFLQHYLWQLAYEPVDRHRAAARVGRRLRGGQRDVRGGGARGARGRPEAAVFFHDYHLYLAPRLVRERAPDALLAHFVHIPWPQTDYWHVLPDRIRRAIHEGLLANDVVGFHTRQWCLNFMRAASDLAEADADFGERVVAHGESRTLVTVHPISVDAPSSTSSPRARPCSRPSGSRRAAAGEAGPARRPHRSFEEHRARLPRLRALPRRHPEMHLRVSMLALLDPSRQDIPEYAEYLGAIQREARRVNDRFQQDGWSPIELWIQDNFIGSVAAYKQFDALFVNAIFDGMNLVAKEAPLVNERDGVLILSENAGAHAELGEWALTVNPFDVAGQAEAIHAALSMGESERRARLEAIRAHVREHDVTEWIEAQLADLDRCRASVS